MFLKFEVRHTPEKSFCNSLFLPIERIDTKVRINTLEEVHLEPNRSFHKTSDTEIHSHTTFYLNQQKLDTQSTTKIINHISHIPALKILVESANIEQLNYKQTFFEQPNQITQLENGITDTSQTLSYQLDLPQTIETGNTSLLSNLRLLYPVKI